jgi:hypothetical protein
MPLNKEQPISIKMMCYMYMCRLRHINGPVLSPLKMEGIRFFFSLYGFETWSLKLSEERRLGVFENRVLRRIFGSKTDGVTGEWRELHNKT